MNNETTQNQINKNKDRGNVLRLKNTDNLIKQIIELKNINSDVGEKKDILELLYMVSCLKRLENKEQNNISSSDFTSGYSYLNNTKH